MRDVLLQRQYDLQLSMVTLVSEAIGVLRDWIVNGEGDQPEAVKTAERILERFGQRPKADSVVSAGAERVGYSAKEVWTLMVTGKLSIEDGVKLQERISEHELRTTQAAIALRLDRLDAAPGRLPPVLIDQPTKPWDVFDGALD